MEAKGLMIGDWVYRPDCYDQIKEIRSKGIIGSDNLRGLIGFGELKPIPLTQKILEKNRFKGESNIFGGKDYTLNEDFILEDRIDRICLCRYCNTEGSLFWICDIKYVHQLQQALRLCEINKEIQL